MSNGNNPIQVCMIYDPSHTRSSRGYIKDKYTKLQLSHSIAYCGICSAFITHSFSHEVSTCFTFCMFCCCLLPVHFTHILYKYLSWLWGNYKVSVNKPWRIWTNINGDYSNYWYYNHSQTQHNTTVHTVYWNALFAQYLQIIKRIMIKMLTRRDNHASPTEWDILINSLRPSDAYMRRYSNQHWFR